MRLMNSILSYRFLSCKMFSVYFFLKKLEISFSTDSFVIGFGVLLRALLLRESERLVSSKLRLLGRLWEADSVICSSWLDCESCYCKSELFWFRSTGFAGFLPRLVDLFFLLVLVVLVCFYVGVAALEAFVSIFMLLFSLELLELSCLKSRDALNFGGRVILAPPRLLSFGFLTSLIRLHSSSSVIYCLLPPVLLKVSSPPRVDEPWFEKLLFFPPKDLGT